ncbi:acyl-CoA dehydrogenase, partial [Pseudomonas sp. FW305-33]
VLAIHDDGAILLPRQHGRTTGSGIHGSMLADVEWAMVPIEAVPLPKYDWLSVGAAIYAALIAGAARRIMELSLQYAHDRTQFAKPIAAFQA